MRADLNARAMASGLIEHLRQRTGAMSDTELLRAVVTIVQDLNYDGKLEIRLIDAAAAELGQPISLERPPVFEDD